MHFAWQLWQNDENIIRVQDQNSKYNYNFIKISIKLTSTLWRDMNYL